MKVKLLTLCVLCCALALLSACRSTEKIVGGKATIGLAFDLAGPTDHSYNEEAYRGIKELAELYHGEDEGDPEHLNYGSELLIRCLQPRSAIEREAVLLELAEEGCPLIYAIGFLYATA